MSAKLPVAKLAPFIIVNVGYVAWLSVKSTPAARSRARLGVSSGVTVSGRRPSHTTMMTLRSGGGAGGAIGVVDAAGALEPHAARKHRRARFDMAASEPRPGGAAVTRLHRAGKR